MSNVTTDPIADMLTRIRNSIAVRQDVVKLPHSKLKESLAELLQKQGYIAGVNVETEKSSIAKYLVLQVRTGADNAKITKIDRISRPGRRQFVKHAFIPTIKNGRGIVIISTSKGIMTGDQAKKLGLGGELICKVY
jgi:small subunit ribosomal protein S8